MQADRLPPRWIVVLAQIAAYILAVFFAGLLYFVRLLLAPPFRFNPADGGMGAWVSRGADAVMLFLAGMILAALQRSILRRWLPRRLKWLAASGLALPALALGVRGLLAPFITQPPLYHDWWGDYATWMAAGRQFWWWSAAAGFAAGLPGGLLFGAAQGAMLPWHRRLWWGLSALAWALIAALALALQNTSAVMFGASD